jgi:hypothetical protein
MLKRLSPLAAVLFLVLSIPATAPASEDEFLWLESAKDPAALAWVENQRAQAETALTTCHDPSDSSWSFCVGNNSSRSGYGSRVTTHS